MSVLVLEQAPATVQPVDVAPVQQDVAPEPVFVAAAVLARMRNGEMPLFLNAYEIMQAFQCLDADRDALYPDDKCSCDAHYDDTIECECDLSYEFHDEDDDTLWERKYYEIAYSDDGEDIRENGVKNPISLQWNPDSIGDSGLPEILGGHHRVALMDRENPFALMPVAFFDDAWTARKSLRGTY